MSAQITLNEIQDFVAVSSAGSIRAAARAQGITPPAMTQSISRLEDKLKAALVIRTSRGITLTEHGQHLLVHYQAISNELARSRQVMRHLQGHDQGEICIGASPTPIMTILPGVLKNFRERFPNVRVNVVGGLYHEHLGELRASRMDFAVGPLPEEGLPDEFSIFPLFRSEPVLAVRRNSPWLKAQRLSDLANASWIMSTTLTRGPGAAIIDLFSANGLPPPRVMLQSTSMTFIASTLLETDFIAALPQCFLKSPIASSSLTQINLDIPLPTYPIGAYCRSNRQLGPFADHMLTLMQRHAHYLA